MHVFFGTMRNVVRTNRFGNSQTGMNLGHLSSNYNEKKNRAGGGEGLTERVELEAKTSALSSGLHAREPEELWMRGKLKWWKLRDIAFARDEDDRLPVAKGANRSGL